MPEKLLRAGYELILLRAGDKRPLEAGWRTSEPLSPEGVAAGKAAGLNIGVRLKRGQVVIDIDPRNFAAGARPDVELGIDRIAAPRVLTPSGGTHVYIKVDPPAKIHHTLRGYPGLEFKTEGRQVVAPGSTHPNGGIYEWDQLEPPIGEEPQCPESLMTLITAPDPLPESDGEWTVRQLAAALAGLSVYDFQDHDGWFSVMCAAHEATGGTGVEEFVGWSMGDELYAGDEAVVRGRWQSLSAGQAGNAGAGTLRKLLLDRGIEPPGGGKVLDFEGVEVDLSSISGNEDLLGPAEVPETLMAKMSRWFKCVDEDGRLRVFTQRQDDVLRRKYWVKYARRDFIEVCASVMHLPDVAVGRTKTGDVKFAPASVAWLDQYKKKETYRGVAFAPEHAAGRTPDGRMNLWQGFPVEARRGEWGWLRELIYEVICGGNGDVDTYVMNWLARAAQRPWEPGGVALVMRGKKGTGKGSLGRAFARLFGQHGMHVTSPDLITGRFNAHLRDCVALFADEAFWAGDKTGESRLKALVTEPALAYEGKGQNAEMGRNCIHVLMASNNDWVVPASADERRFAVVKVADDTGSRVKWEQITRQMNTGLGAMLWDLQARDLSEYDVFAVPKTRALAEQKIRSMEPHEQWLFGLLDSGEWDRLPVVGHNGMRVVLARDLQASLLEFYRAHNRFRAGMESVERHLGYMIRKMCPAVRRIQVERPENRTELPERVWGYWLPSLVDARSDLARQLGHDFWAPEDRSDEMNSGAT